MLKFCSRLIMGNKSQFIDIWKQQNILRNKRNGHILYLAAGADFEKVSLFVWCLLDLEQLFKLAPIRTDLFTIPKTVIPYFKVLSTFCFILLTFDTKNEMHKRFCFYRSRYFGFITEYYAIFSLDNGFLT